ncbi:MAG: SDR family oxidoreductase [Bacteroidota bacterium]
MTVLVTGANRGLGLEFVRQYAAAGATVHACCRTPSGADELYAIPGSVHVHELDVLKHAEIDRLARELEGTPIDILINNAGIYGPRPSQGDYRQTFGHVDYDVMRRVFEVNSLSPLKMAEAFAEHVAASDQKKLVTISSTMGSISNTGGGFLAYRTSKAAVNMIMANLALRLRERGVIVTNFCPGWVKTDMGTDAATLTPETSITGLRTQIAGLTMDDSGSFMRWDGKQIAW